MQTQSEAINELMGAMNQAQLVMSKAKKGSENPHFHSRYADLSTVWDTLEPFREAGIVFTQYPMEGPVGHLTLETQLTHASSGQWIRSRLVIPFVKQDPQAFGSALTYGRRYSLGAMTGLVTEKDDDANLASDPPQTGKTFAEKYPQAVQTVAPDPIVPPGGSQAPPVGHVEGPVWRVPDTPSNRNYKIVGWTASQLKDIQLAWFLKDYQKKIHDDPQSLYAREWESAIWDIEEEIAKRDTGLVLR